MATAKPTTSVALVLRALPHLGASPGDLVSGPDALMKPLIDDGSLDPHPDAVKAGRAGQGNKIKLPEPPDPEVVARLEAARSRVHHLEGLLQVARGDEHDDLQKRLDKARDELQALEA